MQRRTFLIAGASLFASGSALAQVGSTQSTGSKLSVEEMNQCLAMHNHVRQEVGVGPLSWSKKLAQHAQSWAEKLAASGRFQHSGSAYGENLAAAPHIVDAVHMWVKEKDKYRKGMGFTPETGHYTQVVWNKTRYVGMGKADAGQYFIWIANYDPPGNMNGRDPY